MGDARGAQRRDRSRGRNGVPCSLSLSKVYIVSDLDTFTQPPDFLSASHKHISAAALTGGIVAVHTSRHCRVMFNTWKLFIWWCSLALSSLALTLAWTPSSSLPSHHASTALRRGVIGGRRLLSTMTSSEEKQEEEKQRQQQKPVLECQFCRQPFKSRNALFRHLKGEDEDGYDCFVAASKLGGMEAPPSEKEVSLTAVFRYGYLVNENSSTELNTSTDVESNEGYNDVVANMIHQAFVDIVNERLLVGENGTITTSALSSSTAAKLRQPSLRQDEGVLGATAEVFSFNYKLSVPFSSTSGAALKKWKEYSSSDAILEDMQSRLSSNSIQIQLHHMDAITPRSFKFYGERGCSQRVYRYLLPLEWLRFGEKYDSDSDAQLLQWAKGIAAKSLSPSTHRPRKSKSSLAAPECILKLKSALRSAESRTIANRRTRRQEARNSDEETSDGENVIESETPIDQSTDIVLTNTGPIRLAPGRFGLLWRKERRCWSNFAHPALRGMASSPGSETSWRTLDRAHIVGFVDRGISEGEDQESGIQNIHAILEFTGDGFLLGQIPRIISTIIAMTNGWLPSTFFDVATRPDIYIAAPPMVPLVGRMYFHSPRYHFHELTAKGSDGATGFEGTINADLKKENEWEVGLRSSVLDRSSQAKAKDEDWLLELRDTITPTILKQLETIAKSVSTTTKEKDNAASSSEIDSDLDHGTDDDAPSVAYTNTLNLLRDVVANGWPATSSARSRVIRTPSSSKGSSDRAILATKKGSVASTFPGVTLSAGSFTVVNEDKWKSEDGIPLGNTLFPELSRSVFLLEQAIIDATTPPIPSADGMHRQDLSRRTVSTHCAVNRNAQFTPHVDSGRGAGQSVSMILGLGNYAGGEIIVEGTEYDIRYNALEFDGWKQLHWTAPFSGERFSLVWFTPDMKEQSDSSQPTDTNNEEDEQANILVDEHSKVLPYLPPLKFRPDSTDALVINELLNREKGCAYTMQSSVPFSFTLDDHNCVLDIGAHIGVFSRYALEMGCNHVISYEPEPSNFELLTYNLGTIDSLTDAPHPTIELHRAAVAQGNAASGTLVRARNQNNGRLNTWRHSLSEHSQYVDRSTKLPSDTQKGLLERFDVQCVPFFSEDGRQGALVPGVTFVKLDNEGSEIDILLSPKASERSSWLDITQLVVEWSFTKERRVDVFHQMIQNLREAGFEVFYEGMGSWWDGAGILWPFPNDIVVFASIRDGEC